MGNLSVIAFGLAWLFAVAFWPRKAAAQVGRRVWFFSPGIAVSLNRGGQTVLINLHILSTEQTELTYIRNNLMDSTGLCIACEHSEPIAVGKFDLTAKTIV